MMQRVLVIGAALLLGACATGGGRSQAPVEDRQGGDQWPSEQREPADNRQTDSDNSGWQIVEPEQNEAPDADGQAPSGPNPAVASLTRQAEQQYDSGDYRRAIATAERALRIDRRNAGLYLVLAQSYWQLAQPSQSQQFARQGLRYAETGNAVADALNALLEQLR